MNRDMDAGWIVVARIRLRSADGHVESSPFADEAVKYLARASVDELENFSESR